MSSFGIPRRGENAVAWIASPQAGEPWSREQDDRCHLRSVDGPPACDPSLGGLPTRLAQTLLHQYAGDRQYEVEVEYFRLVDKSLEKSVPCVRADGQSNDVSGKRERVVAQVESNLEHPLDRATKTFRVRRRWHIAGDVHQLERRTPSAPSARDETRELPSEGRPYATLTW